MTDLINPIIAKACALILCYVFIIAGWHKLRRRDEFITALTDYRLLPRIVIRPMAFCIPVLEVASSAAILFSVSAQIAGATIAGLLGLYAMAIGINLIRGRRDIDCGCGGYGATQHLSVWQVLRNLLLIGLALLVILRPIGILPNAAAWAISILAAALFCLALQASDQLLANWQKFQALRNL